MSFPRLTCLLVPMALGLPLLTGGCGVPLAVSAASYGADGVSVAATKKTTSDHFVSMVTKEDCSFWRVFKHQKMCKPRETDHDPYQVNYDEPFRMQSEGGGVSYGSPLNASANAPAVSWEASAYTTATPGKAPQQPAVPTTAVAQEPLDAPSAVPTPASATPASLQPAPPQTAAVPQPAKSKKKLASKSKPKKASPSQVASAR
jgi:hypothetical protein